MKTTHVGVFAFAIHSILISAATAWAVSTPPPLVIDFDHATGSTEFHAKGRPSALRINGKGTCPKGQLQWQNGRITGSIAVDLISLDTGIQTRTHHMKEKYLEVEKFPQAKLTLLELNLPSENSIKDFTVEQIPFKGTLMLHGIEKPVQGKVNLDRKGQITHVNAEFGTQISRYGIDVPTFAGITVADDVTIVVEADVPLHPAAHP